MANAKSRDLRHTAGDEGCFCVVPVTKTVSDPGRQGNNVLQRCSCLDPQDIRTRVYTEYRTDEGGLDILRDLLFVGSRNTERWESAAYLLRVARSGKNGCLSHRKLFFYDLGHCIESILLDPLCDIDNELAILTEQFHLLRRTAHENGWDCHHEKVLIRHRFLKISSIDDSSGSVTPGRFLWVLVFAISPRSPPGSRTRVSPHVHCFLAVPRNRGSPCTGTDNTNFFHVQELLFSLRLIFLLYFPDAGLFLSAPELILCADKSLLIFALCLQTAIAIRNKGDGKNSMR